ncbi:hypothetical protein BpHYR1_001868 [Brachionus plicatilis]|uniref:Uncharacterized protein n=1 Tax=Brachionus plicatilis TaxID=10195 RepID=A0A3M7PH07_BRAPC|nr:hypothetical protein BpHYR1_001868 [Brachionus plicatilis]
MGSECTPQKSSMEPMSLKVMSLESGCSKKSFIITFVKTHLIFLSLKIIKATKCEYFLKGKEEERKRTFKPNIKL